MSIQEQISFERIIEITDADPTLMKRLLSILEKNLKDYPEEIQKSFEAQNFKAMTELAHKFKSSVAYLELSSFDTLLAEIEYSQTNGLTTPEIAKLVAQIQTLAHEISQVVAQKKQSL